MRKRAENGSVTSVDRGGRGSIRKNIRKLYIKLTLEEEKIRHWKSSF
jgi:hypothetical protein